MKIEILDSARNHIKLSALFYESQKDGFGDYFVDSILSDIDSLKFFAGVHPVFFKSYFRMHPRRFPNFIFYRVTTDTISVYSVIGQCRDPRWIEQQFS